jgi:hypothetical protein
MKLTKIKILVTLCLLFCLSLGSVTAQVDPNAFGYYQDALRFSQTTFGGSARYQGIAGATTALGGDISSAYSNPAGLGFSRKSEISFTPSFNSTNATSTFQGQDTDDFKLNLNFNHLGVLIASPNTNSSFAITFTRINNFQTRFAYEGNNEENSLIDYLLEQNDAFTPWSSLDNQIDNGYNNISGLAYATYLINPDFEADSLNNRNLYYSFVPITNTLQRETVETKGAQNQWNISYGGNYENKLYYGLSLGIQTLRYDQDKTYEEIPLETGLALNNFRLEEHLRISGAGVNISGGLIYRPTSNIRVGVNFVSPTYLRLTDRYDANINVNYNNVEFEENGEIRVLNNESAETDLIESTYALSTPWRANFGIAAFISKRGFISFDTEYVNYSKAKFSDPDPNFSFNADNSTIQDLYTSALNFRLGGEIRVEKLRFRAGLAYYGDPFNNPEDDIDRSKMIYTLGGGVRHQSYYFDLGFSYNQADSYYSPYTLFNGSQPQVQTQTSQVNLQFGLGMLF